MSKAPRCPFCNEGVVVDSWFTEDFCKVDYSCGSFENTWCNGDVDEHLCAKGIKIKTKGTENEQKERIRS